MAAELQVELFAPDHEPVELTAGEVIVPGAAGVFTVLPGHTPLLSTLVSGAVIIEGPQESPDFYAVHGGFVEVLDNRVIVLADRMEHALQIDPERAKASLERATDRLRAREQSVDVARAEAALARARARLQAHSQEGY